MSLHIEERWSDSPYIERVWRSRSERVDSFTSIASNHVAIAFWKQAGQWNVSVRGPETQASIAPVPNDTEFFGIILRMGTYVPLFPMRDMVNGEVLPAGASSRAFWLQGAAWEYPTFDNAETFVARLVANDLLVHEPVVDVVMAGHRPDISLRTVQRRFLSATGLTYTAIQQIERARKAAILLLEGVSILDTVEEAGYYDQPHLTRSLKHLIGQTPAQLANPQEAALLSFLYKTDTCA